MELTNKPRVCDVDQFDAILVTACDIHGIHRGRFVFRQSVPGAVKNGLGMAQAALFSGILCDIPTQLTDYSDSGWTNGTILPDLGTLRPLPWLSYGGGKVGHVLCDLLDQSREREVSSSREVALLQIEALRSLGYDIVTSYDLQVTVFHKGTLIPVGLHEDISRLLLTLQRSLSESGLPVVSVGRGFEPGQLLISLGDHGGIAASDSLHHLHCSLRSLCVKEGYDITWMTKPLDDLGGNRCSYKIILKYSDGRNAFTDPNSHDSLSDVASHWLGGLLYHSAAITALARPTLNCYSLTDSNHTLKNGWTTDEQDRSCRLQIRGVTATNVSITDRLPSSAHNPYIVLGAMIAAGIDGIKNRLHPGEWASSRFQPKFKTPATLFEALSSLEENKDFKDMIGPKFVHRYLMLKREFEVKRLENRNEHIDRADMLEFERSLYLQSL